MGSESGFDRGGGALDRVSARELEPRRGPRGRERRQLGRQAEVLEDAADDAGFGDQRDDLAPVAALVAAQHIVAEDLLHQLGPRIARVAVVGREAFAAQRSLGRARDDARTNRRGWRERTVISQEMGAWSRDERCQTLEEGERFEDEAARAVAPRTAEGEQKKPAGSRRCPLRRREPNAPDPRTQALSRKSISCRMFSSSSIRAACGRGD